MKQLSLLQNNQEKFYGGSLVKGKRKTMRPLCSRSPIHATLKGEKSINLFNSRVFITSKIRKYSEKFGIKVFGVSVQIDHIHMILQIHDRDQYKKFIRALTGILARRFGKGLFKCLPFTRVGTWGRDFDGVKDYLMKNEFEVWGLQTYEPRVDRYGKYRN